MTGATPRQSETVTFLFTDIEGSTRLLERLDTDYDIALEDHHRLLTEAIVEAGGRVIGTEGDAVFAAFDDPAGALAAGLDGQRRLGVHSWPRDTVMRVRMGIHTGPARLGPTGYVGLAVHQAARTCAAAHGQQVLVSGTTRSMVGDRTPAGASLFDLGEHRLKDLSDTQRLFQLCHPDLRDEFPQLRTLDTAPNNLRALLTSFIGRSEEMASLKHHLDTTRLVTLTGAGGCGKTRLALELAGERLTEFEDGVFSLELAPMSEGGLVGEALAAVLGVREDTVAGLAEGRVIDDAVADFLRDKQVLLILDNCEHLVEECAALAERLLASCPDLRILATSREPLGVIGEAVFRIGSLSVDDEAIRLFVDRATLVDPAFATGTDEQAAIVEICRRLDGIPLAVELAAAKVRVLAPTQIAAKLDDMFRLLTGGSRTALPRQQTLQAAVDWSHDLLDEPERAVLRRLAVFAGGFTLEAAEAVCADDIVDGWDVLDRLGQLVDKSLVNMERGPTGVRYRLLEPVRQYAATRLMNAGEAAATRDRHLRHVARLVIGASQGLRTADEAHWAAVLDVEHDNVQAALQWSQAEGDAALGLAMAGRLARYWSLRGHLTEGREWLERALESTADDVPGRALAHAGAGLLALAMGEDATRSFEACLELAVDDSSSVEGVVLAHVNIARSMAWSDPAGATAHLDSAEAASRDAADPGLRSVVALGRASAEQAADDLVAAEQSLNRAVALARQAGAPSGVAAALLELGMLHSQLGRPAETRVVVEEAVDRSLSDAPGRAVGMRVLAMAYAETGDLKRAEAMAEECLGLAQRVGAGPLIARALNSLGYVTLAQSDPEGARDRFRAALRHAEPGSPSWANICHSLAEAHHVVGRHDDARRLYSDALAAALACDYFSAIFASRHGLGDLRRRQGDLTGARRLHLDAIEGRTSSRAADATTAAVAGGRGARRARPRPCWPAARCGRRCGATSVVSAGPRRPPELHRVFGGRRRRHVRHVQDERPARGACRRTVIR